MVWQGATRECRGKMGTGTCNGYSFAALSVWQMLRIFFMTCIDLWHKTVIDPCQKIRKS